MCTMVAFSWVGLLNQDPVGLAEPNACPCMVCPAQAKGKPRLAKPENLIKRPFEDAFSGEPVMVIAESFYPIRCSHVRLCLPRFGHPQVVETKICRDVRLIMA